MVLKLTLYYFMQADVKRIWLRYSQIITTGLSTQISCDKIGLHDIGIKKHEVQENYIVQVAPSMSCSATTGILLQTWHLIKITKDIEFYIWTCWYSFYKY